MKIVTSNISKVLQMGIQSRYLLHASRDVLITAKEKGCSEK
jgi:hypothetical protein